MENNFIQMDASAVHAVAYTIGSIFKHIIDCVRSCMPPMTSRILSFKAQLSLACRRNTVANHWGKLWLCGTQRRPIETK